MVLAELEAILADRRFASAERNARFLRYVVERTLDGRAQELKETVIATEVYGRAANYDPKSDSIVRVEATRLRQKLRSYYENEGKSAAIRICLPSGAYVPVFEVVQPPVQPAESPAEDPVPPAPSQAAGGPLQHQRLAWAAIAAAVIAPLLLHSMSSARAGERHPEAVAAWREAVALLQQDPHAAHNERGAPATLLRAIDRLEFAVAKDSGFAPAWATLAESYEYAFAFVGRDPASDGQRAEAAARRAVALDDGFAAGHHMLGLVNWMIRWDFPAAEASYRKALELDPQNYYAAVEYADLLREMGRTRDAAALISRSRAILPASPQLAAKDAEIQLDLGHVDAAIAAATASVEINRAFPRGWVALGTAEEIKGDIQSALARYEHVLSADPVDRRALPAYGYLLARMGQRDRAREVARRLEHMNSTVRNCAFQVAVVYAGLGESERALDWLERAWKTHQVHFPFVTVEHRFRHLWKHQGFRGLLTRAGLQPPV